MFNNLIQEDFEMLLEKTALVVEDNEFVRNVLITMLSLESVGFKVVTVEDGQKAIDYLNDSGSNVDLIITDIDLPFRDGFQVAGFAKTKFPGIKIIIISGMPTPERKEKVKSLGAEFFEKPLDVQIFLQRIKEISK